MIAAYFAAVFVDRWHPLRILAYSAIFAGTLSLGGWTWVFVTLPPEAFFWLNMLGLGLLGAFQSALARDAAMPFDIRLLPKSRYGQFCSAQSILANLSRVIGGLAVGFFFTFLKRLFFGESDFVYRFSFLWSAAVNILMAFVIYSLYRQWKALGGDLHFQHPAPWAETGREAADQTPYAGTQTLWLRRALRLINLLFLLTVVCLAGTTWLLWHIGWAFEFRLYLLGILPVASLLYVLWTKVERGILSDVARCAAGEAVKEGIPHHGILYVKAVFMLLGLPVNFATIIVAIFNGMTLGVTVFGIAGQINTLMVIVAVLVLRRMERGFDPMLDYQARLQEEAEKSIPSVA